ncbi:MAG TPA: FixH family protein [Kofleriaceae bacterium]|nr:FixH family protein [Kofleriaceae bacterium]
MSAATRWIGIIVGLLLGNVVAVSVLIGKSSGDTRHRVLPDYYARAAAWDSTMDEAKASVALGWRADLDVDGRQLTLTVVDRAGTPVDGAAVELTAVPRGRVDATVKAVAVAVAPGVYRVALTGKRGGLHDVALSVTRGGDRFVDDRVVDLGSAVGSGSS